MATISPLAGSIAGGTAFTATTPAGDEIAYTGGDLLIEFDNGHASPITVEIEPTQTTGLIQGAGVAPVPTRSLEIAAGAHAAFLFKSNEMRAYLNASKRVPLSYTSGNVALLVRAFALK